jgi:hypothetical protein
VQKRLEVGWKASLTDKQITVHQAHKTEALPEQRLPMGL